MDEGFMRRIEASVTSYELKQLYEYIPALQYVALFKQQK
jgi:hypothetical protein